MRTLLITKDMAWAAELCRSLRQYGIEIEVFDASSASLCTDCVSRSPDVLLVDMERLPKKEDLMIQMIQDSLPLTEIIALYSSRISNQGVMAIRSGVFDCLPKTVNEETLTIKLFAAYRRKINRQSRLETLRANDAPFLLRSKKTEPGL